MPHYTGRLFFELQSKGYVPIIAHPERNKEISANLDVLYELINASVKSVNNGFTNWTSWKEDAKNV